MKQLTIVLLAIFVAVFTASPVSAELHEIIYLKDFHLGMGYDEFKSITFIDPKSKLVLLDGEVLYSAVIYVKKSGTKTETSTTIRTMYAPYMPLKMLLIPETTTREVDVYSDYIFLFKDSELIFYGFLEELSREDNPLYPLAQKLIQASSDPAPARPMPSQGLF